MKKVLILSVLISFAMICSCQKQDSVVEQQLAQRKAEADAREKVLDERMNALDERVKALAEKEKAIANTWRTTTDVQAQTFDPAQVQAERDRAIQQFSAEIRSQIPDDSKMKAEREMERQRGLEKLQRQRQRKLELAGGAVFPAPEATSPTPSPAVESILPTSSPTPE